MKHTANARFALKAWDEKPYSEGVDLPKLTRASVTKTFTGDLEGDGQVEYLMVYRGACAARGRRPWGTATSIRSCSTTTGNNRR
jgi:hypothetical protein